ncbi:MAG: hypothetical protein ACI89E_001085, partial [Planctomycetota bacterium]
MRSFASRALLAYKHGRKERERESNSFGEQRP